MKTVKEIELNLFDLRQEIDYNNKVINKIEDEQIKPLKNSIISSRYKIQNIRETYGRAIAEYEKIHKTKPTHIFDNIDDYYGYKKIHDFCELESAMMNYKGKVLVTIDSNL